MILTVTRKRLTPLHCTVIGWAEASIRSTGNICAKAALDRSFPLRKQISKQKRSIEIYSKKNESHNTVVSMLLQVSLTIFHHANEI